MGSFHCIPSGCAEVVYQEYEGGKIRWQYPGENWREIQGDDYTLETISDTTLNTAYQLVYLSPIIRSGVLQGWSNESVWSTPFNFNGIENFVLQVNWKGNTFDQVNNIHSTFSNGDPGASNRIATYSIKITSQGVTTVRNLSPTFGIWLIRFEPKNINPKPTRCVFKVFRNGAVVHSETRNVCPEVEKIPCSLSDAHKSIEIKKLPYLEKVEVVPFAYSVFRQPGLSPAPIPIPQADPIPPECLNVYKNAIFVIPPNPDALNNPNAIPFDSFITQICSAPSCPPPEYQVICDCNYQNPCEPCPDGTCPIECNGVVCCYNDYGVSIKEISLSDYCGGTNEL